MGVFDPVLIVFQIISLQCLYYFGFGLLIVFTHVICGAGICLEQFFSAESVTFVSFMGIVDVICTLGASVYGSVLLGKIVERSKNCVDFTFTLFFIHLISCSFYEGFPLTWEWWLVHVFASVIMASLGEYVCAQREMEDIPIYNPRRSISV